MTTIRARLPDTIGTLKIEVMADLHIGDAHCDLPLIRERLKSVQEEPDTALILNGDILNNATNLPLARRCCLLALDGAAAGNRMGGP